MKMKFRSLIVVKSAEPGCEAGHGVHCTVLGSTIHILCHHRYR